MSASDIQEIADVCRMLSDPTRLGIVGLLTGGGKSVGALCDKLDLPQPTVSHHLALLRHTSVLARVRKGKQMIYSLNNKQLAPLKKWLSKVK